MNEPGCEIANEKHTVAESSEKCCWFCRVRPADTTVPYIVHLFRVLNRETRWLVLSLEHRLGYEKQLVSVPRCGRCARLHKYESVFQYLLGVVVGIALLVLLFRARSTPSRDGPVGTACIVIVMALVLVGISQVVITFMLQMIAPSLWCSAYKHIKHPQVKLLLSEGWGLGEKPDPKLD